MKKIPGIFPAIPHASMVNVLSSRRPVCASLLHVFKRCIFWLFPALTPIPLYLLGEDLQTSFALPDLALGVVIVGSFTLVVVGCAIFDSLLHLTRLLGLENVQSGQLARCVGVFVAIQFLLVPFLTLLGGAILWSGPIHAP